MKNVEEYLEKYKKKNLPEIKPGDTVRVYEKYFDAKKEKTQVFEGVVIAKKHGEEIGATITVRRIISGVGVEKTFPLHSPAIEKIEIIKRAKVRRAKLYYLRKLLSKKMKLKRKELKEALIQEPTSNTQEDKVNQAEESVPDVQSSRTEEEPKQQNTQENQEEKKKAEVAEQEDARP